MKFSKISRQLALLILLPMLAILVLLSLYIHRNFNQTREIATNKHIQAINEEISRLHSFKLHTLKTLEGEINKQLKTEIQSITEEVELSPVAIEDIDLQSLRDQLDMDISNQDIYIINSSGVIVNTTDPDNYYKNFDNISFTPENQFLDLIGTDEVNIFPFRLEKESGKLRKLTFNTSSRGEFLVMVKSYSRLAQSILDYLDSNIDELIIAHNEIENINIFINSEAPHYLYESETPEVEKTTLVKSVFNNKTKNLQLNQEGNDELKRIYAYRTYQQPSIFNEYVIELIYNHELSFTSFTSFNQNTLFAVGLATLLIISMLFFFMRMYVVHPTYLIKNSLQKLAAGNISEESKLEYARNNEFGELTRIYNQVLEELNDLANFIEELGKGNHDIEFVQEVTEDDVLSQHMLNLRNNIKQLEQERNQRIKQDEISDWMTEGLQDFNQIMQRTGNEINALSSAVLKNLVQYIQAQQGAIYIRANMDKTDSALQQTATFAYNQKVTRTKQIQMREGLVGMVAAEKTMIYRTEIPENYSEISTGLGRTPPNSLLFVPIKIENTVLGVIEIASLRNMEQYHIDFVEKVAANVAHNIMTAKNNEKNEQLLEQFAKQSEQFQQQEKEMKERIDQLETDKKEKDQTIEALRNDIRAINEKLAKARGRINELKQEENINKDSSS